MWIYGCTQDECVKRCFFGPQTTTERVTVLQVVLLNNNKLFSFYLLSENEIATLVQGQKQALACQAETQLEERPDTSPCTTSGMKSLCRRPPNWLSILHSWLSGASTHSDIPLLLSSLHSQVTLMGVVHVCSCGREEKPGHVPRFCKQF